MEIKLLLTFLICFSHLLQLVVIKLRLVLDMKLLYMRIISRKKVFPWQREYFKNV